MERLDWCIMEGDVKFTDSWLKLIPSLYDGLVIHVGKLSAKKKVKAPCEIDLLCYSQQEEICFLHNPVRDDTGLSLFHSNVKEKCRRSCNNPVRMYGCMVRETDHQRSLI